ncbi:MAG: ferritin family protein [Candidatus Aminicenantes bacterium]|nr:ferritin family protein [Candidatus Aminicenantes bacterium]
MTKLNDPNLKWLLKEALKLEIRGKEFFLKAAELTQNNLGRKMFEHLAKEEVRHLETFAHLFTEIIGNEDWRKEISSEDLKENSEVIESLVSRMKGASGKSDLEALSIGLELERKAIDHFQQGVSACSEERTKEIFERIVNEERFHYDLLQAQLDSLQNNGFWLDTSEFRMDGKY